MKISIKKECVILVSMLSVMSGSVKAESFTDQTKFYNSFTVAEATKSLGMQFTGGDKLVAGDIPAFSTIANVQISSPDERRLAVRWSPDYKSQEIVAAGQAEIKGKTPSNKITVLLNSSMSLQRVGSDYYFVSKNPTKLEKFSITTPWYIQDVKADVYEYSLEAAVYNP